MAAEIIGVVASVITIVNLAKPTAKLVRTLNIVAKDGDGMENEIVSVADQLEAASITIDLALRKLQDNCDKIKQMKHPTSRVGKYIEEIDFKRSIRKITRDVKRQMSKADQSLVKTSSSFKFWQGLKWFMWTVNEMKAVFTKLDRVVMCLSIIGPILELEVFSYMLERANGEISGMLESHITTLRIQLEHTERILEKALRSEQSQKSHQKDLSTEFLDCGKLLISLSESMRCTGKVPDDREERRKRRDRNRSTQSTMSAHASVINEPQYAPRSPPRSHKQTGSPHPGRLRVPEVALSEISQQTSRSSRSSSSLTTHTPETPLTPLTVLTTPPSPPIPPIPPSPSSPPSPPTPPSPDSDDETINLITPADVKEGTIHIISGWLENRNGPNSLARIERARIYPNMPGNYMSLAQALDLSLPVEQSKSREFIHPLDPKESGRIVGKVLGVQWCGKKHSTTKLVDFWVKEQYCKGEEYDVMFGSEFAKEIGWKELTYSYRTKA